MYSPAGRSEKILLVCQSSLPVVIVKSGVPIALLTITSSSPFESPKQRTSVTIMSSITISVGLFKVIVGVIAGPQLLES